MATTAASCTAARTQTSAVQNTVGKSARLAYKIFPLHLNRFRAVCQKTPFSTAQSQPVWLPAYRAVTIHILCVKIKRQLTTAPHCNQGVVPTAETEAEHHSRERKSPMLRITCRRQKWGYILFLASAALVGCHQSPPATLGTTVPPTATVAPSLTVQQSNQLLAEFRQKVKADPHDTSDKIGIATELNRQGKTEEAISVLKEAEKTSTDPGLTRTAHKFLAELEKQPASTKG